MGRRKKYKEGTAEAFRNKKDVSKITLNDAQAIIKELDDIYTKYRSKYDDEIDLTEKHNIESDYLYETFDDIQKIKSVAGQYWELQPGVGDVLSDVYYNMKYTKMIGGREATQKKTKRGMK